MADHQENLKEANRRIQECLDSRASELDLSNLQLAIIPQLLEQYSVELNGHLTTLYLDDNRLTDIKPLLRLTNLNILNLYQNKLTDIQPLVHLTNLTKLQLASNQISDIESLKNLIQLTELWLSDNQISNITSINSLTKLTILRLAGNRISKIETLSNVIQLTTLDLSHNQISNIECLKNLTNLTKLDLAGNQISNINSLKNLIQLTTLRLSRNQINNINSLNNLIKLTELYLSANQINDIESLNNLIQLFILYLSDNQISNIETLHKLTLLTSLSLSGNQINSIESLKNLTNLTKLDVDNNQLTDIYPLEDLLKNKDKDNFEIRIDNNPFWQETNIIPANDIFANHYDDLMLYFQKLHTEQVQMFLPQKVVFLGNHESGKSSTLEFLKSKQLTSATESTHILDIEYILPENYQVKEKTEEMFQASCYDFGGQDFYHGIYRIFLQDASIALLLINPKHNHNHQALQNQDSRRDTLAEQYTQHFDVRYWRGLLNYMHSPYNRKPQSDDSMAVFLLQSHADKMPMMDWSLPALISAKISANQSQPIAEHSKTEQSKQTIEKVKQKPIQLAGFYHVDLATVNLQENRSTPQLEFFSQQFKQCLKDKQRPIEIPLAEVEFLKALMQRANEPSSQETSDNEKNDTNTNTNDKDNSDNTKKYDCQPTRFAELKDKFEFLFDKSDTDELTEQQEKDGFKNIKTQIKQYHKAGMVLYDESLSINQLENIKEHIVWLNPQGLIEFIHDKILSTSHIADKKGKIAKEYFDKFFTKIEHKKVIIELLKNHQVIFEHKYKEGKNSNDFYHEYIIPNYLPLAKDDSSYELIHDGIGKPAFCLAFTDFIPMGMINQFVNLFGRQLDKKMFWRDAMIFTLSSNSEKLFKIHIHIDMKNLIITVHVIDLMNKGTKAVISYLYYCLMNAYWNYLTNLSPISYELFSELIKYSPQTIIAEDMSSEPKEYQFISQLFYENTNYIPEDMYISRDGKNFVKYFDIINTQIPKVSSYKKNIKNQSDIEDMNFVDTERMVCTEESISVENFQYFTSKPLKCTARIFISYSHLDRGYKEDLFTHLVMLRRQGHHIFDDTQIGVGKFDEKIQKELKEADIVLFLLSANFFNSEYIFYKEMTTVIQNNFKSDHKQIIIPVLVKHFDYHSLAEITNDAFTSDDLDNLLDKDKYSIESFNKNIQAMEEFGKYLFLPYHKNTHDGTGMLLPIQGWEKDKRDDAYSQIAEIIRKQIKNLPIKRFRPIITNEINTKFARIFISYSHLDAEYKENLMVHLSILKRQGHHIFADTEINTGSKFDKRIQEELEQADIVIFMMSANFFNSDYIMNNELANVLANNQNGKGKKQVVIPVLAKYFDYHSLSSLITDDFTQENFENFVNASDDERDSEMMQKCGKYLFRPYYYRDEKKGIGKILPIQGWSYDERNKAYAQIAQVVREAIGKL